MFLYKPVINSSVFLSMVERVISGKFLHKEGPPCPIPSIKETPKEVLSNQMLKVTKDFFNQDLTESEVL